MSELLLQVQNLTMQKMLYVSVHQNEKLQPKNNQEAETNQEKEENRRKYSVTTS